MNSSLWYQGFESGIDQTVQRLLSFGHCKVVIWSVFEFCNFLKILMILSILAI